MWLRPLLFLYGCKAFPVHLPPVFSHHLPWNTQLKGYNRGRSLTVSILILSQWNQWASEGRADWFGWPSLRPSLPLSASPSTFPVILEIKG